MHVPFSTKDDGKTIIVPPDQVLTLRMQLAQEGIPSSTVHGYEIFDHNDFFSTSQFVNDINLVRALEGELAKTIMSLSEVDKARVHLVLPKNDAFSRSGTNASASIFLKLKPGIKLSKDATNGITHLVLTAVPGLDLKNITIIDQNGKTLKIANEDVDSTSNDLNEYKLKIEQKLKLAIENILEKYVGIDKVQANVTAEIDFDKTLINKEIYDPDSQVIRSQKLTKDQEIEKDKNDNVSVATNLPNFLQQNDFKDIKERSFETQINNYEISKTTTNTVVQSGSIKQLSVAVLIDGHHKKNPQTNEDIYEPRSKQELEQLKALVSAAIGLDETRGDKIELINLPFINNSVNDYNEDMVVDNINILLIVKIIIIGIILIIITYIFIKPMFFKKQTPNISGPTIKSNQDTIQPLNINEKEIKNKQFSNINNERDVNNERDFKNNENVENDAIDFGTFDNNNNDNLTEYLEGLLQSNPDKAIKVLRTWLTQE
jgi:flagellar M-ring protein FliF